METTTILYIAICVLFVLLAWTAATSTSRKRKLNKCWEDKDELVDRLSREVRSSNNWETKYNQKVSEIVSLKNELINMEAKFSTLENDLVNNLVATTDKGEFVDYYRVKEVTDSKEFKDSKVGDKVAHIRRKVGDKWKNVPVALTLKRK